MSLINYVQVYRSGSGLHVQATGPAFPTGYASGHIPNSTTTINAECDGPKGRKGVSMRPGSGARYLPCTVDGTYICTPNGIAIIAVGALCSILGAPSPAYATSATARVGEQVATAVKVGTGPDPAPVKAETCAKDVDITALSVELAKVLVKFLK